MQLYRHVTKHLDKVSGAWKRVGMAGQHEFDSVIKTAPRERHVSISGKAVVMQESVIVANSPLLQSAHITLIIITAITRGLLMSLV